MIMSSKPRVINKSLVLLFLTYLLLLKLQIILFFLKVFHPGFSISSTALSWIKSYSLNHSFYVNIEYSKSSVFQFLYGVTQGSVLGPLLFILCIIPLITVISNSSANHQLYADDTQILLSFSTLDVSHSITHLEHTITNVSTWMSSNSVSLNPSKTEFLVFSLPQQLFKFNNPIIHLPNNVILSPVDSARNLGVIFDKNLSFAQHISSISKSCFFNIMLVILVSYITKICHLHNVISSIPKSCFHNIRDLRHIRYTIDQTTGCTIGQSAFFSYSVVFIYESWSYLI